jgi:hypothetical protein
MCPDCPPNKLCGICEEKALAERTKWWQDGKKKLQEKLEDESRTTKERVRD